LDQLDGVVIGGGVDGLIGLVLAVGKPLEGCLFLRRRL
jgi:hypothetical protein